MKMQFAVHSSGEPLVLVPGGLTGWISWVQHAERLSALRQVTRVQLISVQYGLEGRDLPRDYSIQTESRALAATLDDLGLTGPIDLTAWSYGAAVTLDYVLDHPDRVRSLTLIEPPALWVLGDGAPEGTEYLSLRRLRDEISHPVTEDQLEEFTHAAGFVPHDISPRTLPQWPLWRQHRQSLLNTEAVFANRNDPDRLNEFQPPVLLVKGTGSSRFLHQIMDTLAARLPNSRLIELPGGHAPHIASMDAFLEEFTAFLKEPTTASPLLTT